MGDEPLGEIAAAGRLDRANRGPHCRLHIACGEQQAGVILNRANKIAIAQSLSELGVYEIVAGTPASSREDFDAVGVAFLGVAEEMIH
jgi:hypothetical protein